MNQELVKKYTQIKQQISVLSNEAEIIEEEIKPEVINFIKESEFDNIETEFGKLTLRTIKTWKYPSYVKEAESKLKEEKKKSEENGDAKFEEKVGLLFRTKTEKVGN